MTRRTGLIVVLVAAMSFLAAATAVHQVDARASSGERIVVSLGDRILLDRAPVGCRVARLAGHGGQAFVDCRRAGALKGTYGTYFGKRKVLVVRYVGDHTARVVFQARHEEVADRCR
jgi:hypothetical protein